MPAIRLGRHFLRKPENSRQKKGRNIMLEWLKTILGDRYTYEIDQKVSAEIGKGFVSKTDFNAAKAELKTARETITERDTQLETLKKSTGDVDALKNQIIQLQKDNKNAEAAHAAEMTRLRIDTAVEQALTAAGARNNTAVKALMTDFLKGAKLGEDGTVAGLSDAVTKLSEDAGTAFLFGGKSDKPLPGAVPAFPGRNGAAAGTQTDEPVII